MRVSKTFFRRMATHQLLVDVRNDTAEEGLVSENLFSPNFGLAAAFVDPRRALVGLRVNLGR